VVKKTNLLKTSAPNLHNIWQ